MKVDFLHRNENLSTQICNKNDSQHFKTFYYDLKVQCTKTKITISHLHFQLIFEKSPNKIN